MAIKLECGKIIPKCSNCEHNKDYSSWQYKNPCGKQFCIYGCNVCKNPCEAKENMSW
jgi:hypothetical protein